MQEEFVNVIERFLFNKEIFDEVSEYISLRLIVEFRNTVILETSLIIDATVYCEISSRMSIPLESKEYETVRSGQLQRNIDMLFGQIPARV